MQQIVVYFLLLCAIIPSAVPRRKSVRTQDLMINFVRDNLKDISRQFNKTDAIRQMSRQSASFEIGFVLKSMEECYRRMVDIYNSSLTTDMTSWDVKTTDHIIFLKHVEILHWVLEHLSNMLHEIEKKYKIKTAGMFEKHPVWTTNTPWTRSFKYRMGSPGVFTTTTKRPTKSWWPLEYGWEVNYEWR